MTAQNGALAFLLDLAPDVEPYAVAAARGLATAPRSLPAKYFYDARGSALFESICRAPEYYVPQAELAIYDHHGAAIAAAIGPGAAVIELGTGSSRKINALLGALEAPAAYVAIDIERTALTATAAEIARRFPRLLVGAVCADFTRTLNLPDEVHAAGRPIGFFPGSTIGNFSDDEAAALLASARVMLGPQARMLIGFDRVKDRAVLEAAYNDAEGVTAEFNRNLIHRLRGEVGVDVDPDAFDHVAFFNADAGRIEMHLRARVPVTFTIAGRPITLAEGETIHTENSNKYTPERLRSVVQAAGFSVDQVWSDPAGLFGVALVAEAGGGIRDEF